jgi:hypothetical protein
VLPADTPFTSMDDAVIIDSSEDLDLLVDLDFVTWMIEQDDSG